MEMLTLKDSTSPVFLVTDLLRGVRYFVADRGSHYEIEVPTKAGSVRVAVSHEMDAIDVADELMWLLDAAKSMCLTPNPSIESSSGIYFRDGFPVISPLLTG